MSAPRWWELEVLVEMDPLVPDGYMKHHIAIPDGCCEEATVGARVEGTLDGASFSRVVTGGPGSGRLVRFGRDWLRDAGIEVGDLVALQMRLDPDPDHVDIPEELARALDEAPALEHRWLSLTPGRRRTLIYPVERAKQPETRARRVQAIIDELDRPTTEPGHPR